MNAKSRSRDITSNYTSAPLTRFSVPACNEKARDRYWTRNFGEAQLKFDIPEKIDATLFKQIAMELLALLGCLALAGTLAVAVRLAIGKW